MIPPFYGGLHCSHGYTVNLPEGWAGAPAGHRRAPLRHREQRVHSDPDQVLPPFNGGLHCGTVMPWFSIVGVIKCSRR